MNKVYIYPLKTAEMQKLIEKSKLPDYTLGEFVDIKSHEYLPKFVDYEANPIEAVCLGAIEKKVYIPALYDEGMRDIKMSTHRLSEYIDNSAYKDVLCLVVSINNEIKSIPAHRCKTTPIHKS